MTSPVPRTPPRNVQVYNPTPDSLSVRWEPASGRVQQYRVAYSALSGAARPKTVSGMIPGLKGDLERMERWNVSKAFKNAQFWAGLRTHGSTAPVATADEGTVETSC